MTQLNDSSPSYMSSSVVLIQSSMLVVPLGKTFSIDPSSNLSHTPVMYG